MSRASLYISSPKQLGAILKSIRHNLNMSQEYVAEQLKINRSTYSYYEIGKTTPSIFTLIKLSEIFKIPPEVFFYRINIR